MARKQLGSAPSAAEDAATKAYVDDAQTNLKQYASEAEFDAETETCMGVLSPATNWGAYTGITSPSVRNLSAYSGPALVQTVHSIRSGAATRTQFITIADDQDANSTPTRRLIRRGTDITWFSWRYDNLVPSPLDPGEAANKGYVDSVGLTLVSNWSGLDSLSVYHTQVGLVANPGFDLGASTGIAKYNGLGYGQVWFESHAGYTTAGFDTSVVQRAWIHNHDGTVDEIRRTKIGTAAWTAWAIYAPSGGSGIAPTLIDAKGDLIIGTADDTPARMAVGANGLALIADSAETTGARWSPANRYVGINAQTGTSYTPVLADEGKLVTLTNAGAITVTLPQDSSVAIPVGGSIDFVVRGAGMATFVAGSGANPIEATPSAITRAQYSGVTAVKIAADTWWITGDLA